jgi:hypothetical protein
VELRCQVYEYFVVAGKIFYSPDEYSVRNEKRFKDWEAYRAPELTILRVCKQLHSEAEKIYLSKNLFVLPDFLSHREPFRQYPRQEACVSLPDRPLFSKAAAKILKNISVSFNPRVPTPELLDYSHWNSMERESSDLKFDTLSAQERLERAHDESSFMLKDTWENEMDSMITFFPTFKINRLRYVEIDVTNAYCQIGCCRLHGDSVPYLIFMQEPLNVTILGVRHKSEEEDTMEMILDYFAEVGEFKEFTKEGIRQAHNMKFDPEDDVWAKWKMDNGKSPSKNAVDSDEED